MLLGVIIGSGFVAKPELKVILGTILTTSLALGVSSGVSVYEAEILERERRIKEMEEAVLMSLEGTEVAESAKKTAIIVASVNLLTPLSVCTVYMVPFALAYLGFIEIWMASWISVPIALGILMFVGAYMGRNGKGNAVLKGVRMAALGGITFLAGYWIETLI